MAVDMYASDWGEYFPPGAEDAEVAVPSTRPALTAGYWRWHGMRKDGDYPFDPRAGYLAPYLGFAPRRIAAVRSDPRSPEELLGEIRKLDAIKMCPSFRGSYDEGLKNSFEWGAGGYGYNCWSVGSQEAWYGSTLNWTGVMDPTHPDYAKSSTSWWHGAPRPLFQDPRHTIMFADAAYPQPTYYAESHELVPPYFMESYTTDPTTWLPKPEAYRYGRPEPVKAWGYANPTIHFRHAGQANVLWLDGHVDAHRMDFTRPGPNIYGADSGRMNVGWFGPDDFSLWDYR
jgi:prepilin-type processing-associated H-X9-DG protein